MDDKIIVDVSLSVDGGANVQVDGTPATAQDLQDTKRDAVMQSISARQLIKVGTKALNTFAPDMASSVQGATRYGFKMANFIKSAMSGNPLNIAMSGLNIVGDLVTTLISDNLEIKKRLNALENQADDARVKAGLMNIENTIIQTNWMTGKRSYQKG